MIFNSDVEEISQITFDYIKAFPTKSSFENYVPHITLGADSIDLETGSFEFVSQELALCHLGNYCTCRKVLLSHTI